MNRLSIISLLRGSRPLWERPQGSQSQRVKEHQGKTVSSGVTSTSALRRSRQCWLLAQYPPASISACRGWALSPCPSCGTPRRRGIGSVRGLVPMR